MDLQVFGKVFGMQVLITGISGFLGWNLVERFRQEPDMEILGTHFQNPAPEDLYSFPVDLEKPSTLRQALFGASPDVVIHTAAMPGVMDCERNPVQSRAINQESVSALVKVLAPSRTQLIYCSTDLVFDGHMPPYCENKMRSPRCVYATTKAGGEREALAYSGKSSVARLALMFGQGPRPDSCFLGWLDKGLKSSEGVTAFRDEIRTALYARDAAEAILQMVRREATGIFHLGGPEALSREAFARLYAEVFDLDQSRVHSALQPQAAGDIHRPPDVSLDITRARQELGFAPLGMREALEDLKKRRASFRPST
jgi:dTDP-4-dehydrorhamnose reductase